MKEIPVYGGLNRGKYHVGYFATIEEAVDARNKFLVERGVAVD